MADEEYSNDNSDQKISKFNSTIAILYRIDNLWKDAHNHARSGEMMKWNFDLDRVWCELYDDVDEEQITKFNSFNDTIKENLKNGEKLYQAILSKELFLRLLQKKQGKGVAYQDSTAEYMD
jgi:hypothetical protein